MKDKMSLIREKIDLLNRASKSYYQNAEELMSNFEYDKLYDAYRLATKYYQNNLSSSAGHIAREYLHNRKISRS